jgi:hypothetical protein
MPSPIIAVFFCVLAFALAASSDWLETRYVRAVRAWEDARGSAEGLVARERAARSSVAMWLVSVVALITVVEVGWWVLAPEGLGLYVGTKLAMR